MLARLLVMVLIGALLLLLGPHGEVATSGSLVGDLGWFVAYVSYALALSLQVREYLASRWSGVGRRR